MSNWQGCLKIEYGDRNGETQVLHSFTQSPLKLQRPFYPEGKGICHSVALHTAGGMVGGDQLTQEITLQPQAKALMTTAAAAKVYGSNGQWASQSVNIQIQPTAYLEWLPQETIIFNGAQFQSNLRVELAPGASWLGWEINRLGRSARGEKFLQGEWRSRTEVWQNGKPLWIDRQRLLGGESSFFNSHGLAGKPVVATLIAIGLPISPEIIEKARSLWQGSPSSDIGVTSTLENGLLCRYRGASTAEARNWFIAVWQLLRLSSQQCPVTIPRVWQL